MAWEVKAEFVGTGLRDYRQLDDAPFFSAKTFGLSIRMLKLAQRGRSLGHRLTSYRYLALTPENRWNVNKLLKDKKPKPLLEYLSNIEKEIDGSDKTAAMSPIEVGKKFAQLFADEKGGKDLEMAFSSLKVLHKSYDHTLYQGLLAMIDSFLILEDSESVMRCYKQLVRHRLALDLTTTQRFISLLAKQLQFLPMFYVLDKQESISHRMLISICEPLILSGKIDLFANYLQLYVKQQEAALLHSIPSIPSGNITNKNSAYEQFPSLLVSTSYEASSVQPVHPPTINNNNVSLVKEKLLAVNCHLAMIIQSTLKARILRSLGRSPLSPQEVSGIDAIEDILIDYLETASKVRTEVVHYQQWKEKQDKRNELQQQQQMRDRSVSPTQPSNSHGINNNNHHNHNNNNKKKEDLIAETVEIVRMQRLSYFATTVLSNYLELLETWSGESILLPSILSTSSSSSTASSISGTTKEAKLMKNRRGWVGSKRQQRLLERRQRVQELVLAAVQPYGLPTQDRRLWSSTTGTGTRPITAPTAIISSDVGYLVEHRKVEIPPVYPYYPFSNNNKHYNNNFNNNHLNKKPNSDNKEVIELWQMARDRNVTRLTPALYPVVHSLNNNNNNNHNNHNNNGDNNNTFTTASSPTSTSSSSSLYPTGSSSLIQSDHLLDLTHEIMLSQQQQQQQQQQQSSDRRKSSKTLSTSSLLPLYRADIFPPNYSTNSNSVTASTSTISNSVSFSGNSSYEAERRYVDLLLLEMFPPVPPLYHHYPRQQASRRGQGLRGVCDDLEDDGEDDEDDEREEGDDLRLLRHLEAALSDEGLEDDQDDDDDGYDEDEEDDFDEDDFDDDDDDDDDDGEDFEAEEHELLGRHSHNSNRQGTGGSGGKVSSKGKEDVYDYTYDYNYDDNMVLPPADLTKLAADLAIELAADLDELVSDNKLDSSEEDEDEEDSAKDDDSDDGGSGISRSNSTSSTSSDSSHSSHHSISSTETRYSNSSSLSSISSLAQRYEAEHHWVSTLPPSHSSSRILYDDDHQEDDDRADKERVKRDQLLYEITKLPSNSIDDVTEEVHRYYTTISAAADTVITALLDSSTQQLELQRKAKPTTTTRKAAVTTKSSSSNERRPSKRGADITQLVEVAARLMERKQQSRVPRLLFDDDLFDDYGYFYEHHSLFDDEKTVKEQSATSKKPATGNGGDGGGGGGGGEGMLTKAATNEADDVDQPPRPDDNGGGGTTVSSNSGLHKKKTITSQDKVKD